MKTQTGLPKLLTKTCLKWLAGLSWFNMVCLVSQPGVRPANKCLLWVHLHDNNCTKTEKFTLCVFEIFCVQTKMWSKRPLLTWIHEKTKALYFACQATSLAISLCKETLCVWMHMHAHNVTVFTNLRFHSVQPVFKSCPKMPLSCKWMAKTHKFSIFSWKTCCVNTP